MCKCPIKFCKEVDCEGCDINAHISCSCERQKKIPVKELFYIKGQREKIGSRGSHQIGAPDLVESKKVMKKMERIEFEKRAMKKRMSKEKDDIVREKIAREEVDAFFGEEIDEMEEACQSDNENEAGSSKEKRNYESIRNVALASMRYGVGLRATAAIATAALIDAGIITEDDKSKVIDKSKVMRAQEKLMKELGDEFD